MAGVRLEDKSQHFIVDDNGTPVELIGATGPTGPTGPTGAVGNTGNTGSTGATGATGADSNVTGPTGAVGNTGNTGPTGAQGNTGADSTVTGPTGAVGNTGNTGPTGAQGVTGNTGFTGATGNTGASPYISYQWQFDDSSTTTPASGFFSFNNGSPASSTTMFIHQSNAQGFNFTGVLGGLPIGSQLLCTSQDQLTNFFLVLSSTPSLTGSVYSFTFTRLGTSGSPTLNQTFSILIVPTGKTGVTGATGVTGPTGAVGNTGNTGNTGPTGAVGNTGFTGFTGSTGAVGNTGNTGPTGAVGNTGNTGATGNTGNTGAGPTGATGATGSGGGSSAQNVTANITLVSGDSGKTLMIRSSNGPINVTFPNPTSGQFSITIKDADFLAATNNITFVRNGSENFEGLAQSYVANASGGSFTIQTDLVDWFIVGR